MSSSRRDGSSRRSSGDYYSGDGDSLASRSIWSEEEEAVDSEAGRRRVLGYSPKAPPPRLDGVRSRIDNRRNPHHDEQDKRRTRPKSKSQDTSRRSRSYDGSRRYEEGRRHDAGDRAWPQTPDHTRVRLVFIHSILHLLLLLWVFLTDVSENPFYCERS